jgi:hypothetical protein
MFRLKFLSNIALGTAIGALSAFLISWLVDAEVGTWIEGNAAVLFSASASLFAATLALSGVLHNISSQADQREADRRAELSASKAVLPIALSEMHRIAGNHMLFEIDRDPDRKIDDWNLSETSLSVFRECIEFSSGLPHETLRELAAAYQICIARGHETNRSVRNEKEMSLIYFSKNVSKLERIQRFQTMKDWASLQALNDSLFKFSRGVSDTVNRLDVSDNTIRVLNEIGLDDGIHISNDPTFAEGMDWARDHKMFSFNDPNWLDRDR